MKHISIIFLFFSSTLLLGCSSSVKAPALTQQQVDQLATLVASSSYLREQCQRSDVPAESVLLKTALLQARTKGWSLAPGTEQAVRQRAVSLLSDLTHDQTPVAEKCVYFNQHLAAFVEQSRRQ